MPGHLPECGDDLPGARPDPVREREHARRGRRRRRPRPPCGRLPPARSPGRGPPRRPPSRRQGASSRRAGEPTLTRMPSTSAVTPRPGVEENSSLCGTTTSRSWAAATTARASGCSLGRSAAAARASRRSLVRPARCNGLDLGDARGALGEGARLVEGDQVGLAELLEGDRALDQYAVAAGVRDGREQRRHRRQDHGAGRRDDHEGHRSQQGGLEGGAEGQGNEEQGQRGDDHAHGVALLDLLDEQLGARLGLRGLLDHGDDPRDDRVLGRSVRPSRGGRRCR